MAISASQFMDKILNAASGSRGELLNALRDFTVPIDSAKLSSMSDSEVKALAKSLGAGGAANRNSAIKAIQHYTNIDNSLENDLSNLTSLLEAQASGKTLSSTNTKKLNELKKNVETAVGKLLSTNQTLFDKGIVPTPPEQTFSKYFGENFDPLAQARAEGQTIPGEEPAAGTTGTTGTPPPAPISIPFKDGLSDTQKQSITNLTQKPVDQWTETDKKNWAYATNNAALPSVGSPGASGGPPAGATKISGPSGLQGLSESQIWRDPNGKDIYKLPSIDTTGISSLPPDQQEAAQHLIDNVSNDAQLLATMDFSPEGIKAAIDRFRPTAAAETDPYYNQLYTRATENYTYGLDQLAKQRKAQLETEALNAQLNMEQADTNAAEAGLATSGIRKKLQDRLNAQAENIAQSDLAVFNDTARTFGRSAEDLLGTHLPTTGIPTINGVPVFTATPGVHGTIEANQATANETRARELAQKSAISSLSGLSDAAAAGVAEKFA